MVKFRLPRWRGDIHLGRVFKNFGLLLSGRGVAGLFSLATLALMGHGLTPVQFGIVILVDTFVLTTKGFVTLQPVAAVIHFGVSALREKDDDGFKRLISYTVLVDLIGGFGAAILAIVLAPIAGKHLHWSQEVVLFAQLYSSILFISAEPTAKGVLRLYNRFDLLSLQIIIRPILRLVGVGIAFMMHAPVIGYLLAWYISNLVHYFTLVFIARYEMRKHLSGPLFVGLQAAQVHRDCPRFWHYMITLYWQNLLDLMQKQVATLFVGVLFGPAAAGLYKVAWDFSNVLAKPVFMLRNLILPDLARLWHDKDRAFRRLTFRSGLIAGSVSTLIFVIIIFTGRDLITAIMGLSYAGAAPLLILLVLASTIDLYGFALRPAGYAMGRPGVIVTINTVATVIYALLFFGLASRFGLLAPGLASTSAALISLLSLSIAVLGLSRRLSP